MSTGTVDEFTWPGFTYGAALNSFGDAVGWGYLDAGNTQQSAWIFSARTGFVKLNTLIDPASGWDLRVPSGINDSGDVVGWGVHNGRVSAFRVRIPLRTSSGGPMVAEVHTYGYDGLRTSTTTAPGMPGASAQVWFTQDYTEHDGIRDHYVRVGDRIVAKVTLQPPVGGAMGLVRDTRKPPRDLGNLVAEGLLALLLAGGLGVTAAGFVGRKRRPAWVAATAGPIAFFFVASCEMVGANRQSAQTLWQRVSVVYFHHGMAAGPVITTNSDGTLREERRYEPFGQPIDANVGGTIGPVDFRREQQNSLGKLTDPSTGWSYHDARWMQSATARWTAPDPRIKTPDRGLVEAFWDLSPYSYGRNNPAMFADPHGAVPVEVDPCFGDGSESPPQLDDPGDNYATDDYLQPQRHVSGAVDGSGIGGSVYSSVNDHTESYSNWDSRVSERFEVSPGLISGHGANHERQYGQPPTMEALRAAGREWEKFRAAEKDKGNAVPPLAIGSISLEGGGPMDGHKSHQKGVDVDVRVVEKDGKYSKDWTREAIQSFRKQDVLPIDRTFFDRPVGVPGVGPDPRGSEHWDHFHVRFKDPQ